MVCRHVGELDAPAGEESRWADEEGVDPLATHKLSEQQKGEIRARLRVGEPKDSIARAYKVDADTVRQVGR
jgi:hypothetical protein